MKDFVYYAPTKVFFGKYSEEKTGEIISSYKYKKVLIHYGGGSAEKSGLLGRVRQALKKADIQFIELGGVVPNPRLSLVREGIALCRKENVDFILAVGGGSVIDSAKAIGYGVDASADVWDFYLGKAVPQSCLPIGVVLTISAAGSEMSNSSVITNEDGWLKRGCKHDICRCKFVTLNPELTYTLPAYQTACGCVDIMMHSMERYFTKEKDLFLTEALGEAVMRTILVNAPVALAKSEDYNSHAQIMWASSLSHNGLTGCGSVEDWACHQLEHELSGIFDVAHGAGLAAIWGSWSRYVYKEYPRKFAKFAVNVMGVQGSENAEETALKGIEALENFFRSIGMPTSIKELGIELTDALAKELAYKCSFQGKRTVGNFKQLDINDMENIYRMAK